MHISKTLLMVACAALLGSCAATVPQELSDARSANLRASNGQAADVAPVELHQAAEALQKAEAEFKDHPKSAETRDLSYIAQRRAEIAEATASLEVAKKHQADAQADLLASQSEIARTAQQDLAQVKSEQAATKHSDALAAERRARTEAEQNAADALAKLAAVNEDARGMVISLTGSVLFTTNQSTLLPSATARLQQVAAVLLESPERNLLIEGHTDSQGSDSYNQTLSQARADRVRDLLVQSGYRSALIKSSGMGEARPVGDNATAEGRANNRRVEIVIVRPDTSQR
ncbi:MAG: OmpA family protein [Candidatus Delongbacteria bacterium]|nr:OmpA family protein [Candidatus Delongbacteria bacterium]